VHLSVVIPATDGSITLGACLDAITASATPPDDVIVVQSPSMPAPPHPGVVSIPSAAHGGPAAARNAGAAYATGDVVVFVDADVALKPDAFDRIRAWFADPAVDAVFGSYCDTPAAPGAVSGFRNLLHHHVHQGGAGRAETFWTGLGAIRRDVLFATGGLDDELRYLEDLELGYRLTEHGARIELDPQLQGTHLKSYTVRGMVRTDLHERAIPWVRLALEGRVSASALNAGGRHRASAGLSLALPASAATGHMLLALIGLVAMVALNLGLYGLLARRLGWRGAVLGLPLHMLHHLTALCGVPVAIAQHLLHERRVAALAAPETFVPALEEAAVGTAVAPSIAAGRAPEA
jgi:GT2 family glycosyltransferase